MADLRNVAPKFGQYTVHELESEVDALRAKVSKAKPHEVDALAQEARALSDRILAELNRDDLQKVAAGEAFFEKHSGINWLLNLRSHHADYASMIDAPKYEVAGDRRAHDASLALGVQLAETKYQTALKEIKAWKRIGGDSVALGAAVSGKPAHQVMRLVEDLALTTEQKGSLGLNSHLFPVATAIAEDSTSILSVWKNASQRPPVTPEAVALLTAQTGTTLDAFSDLWRLAGSKDEQVSTILAAAAAVSGETAETITAKFEAVGAGAGYPASPEHAASWLYIAAVTGAPAEDVKAAWGQWEDLRNDRASILLTAASIAGKLSHAEVDELRRAVSRFGEDSDQTAVLTLATVAHHKGGEVAATAARFLPLWMMLQP